MSHPAPVEPFISGPDLDDLTEPTGPPADGARVAAGNGDEPIAGDDLQALVSEITGDVEIEPLKLKVDGRPGWSLWLRTDVAEDDLTKFGKLADRKRKKGRPRVGVGQPETDVSEARMSALLLAAYNVGIYRNGQPLVDNDSDPITLRSPELHDLLGVTRGDPYPSATAVRVLYGSLDGHIIAAGRALLGASGFLSEPDEDEDEPGPTTAP